ncbi:Acetyltransferase, GNAT family [Micromonospora peucetia]|uniref:Acetyltransferase, GNAT family n=2 Tax=Micromonospora peucetia TaxID=47871 RepID=A0A1C6VMK2_9ACTN|nr:Acetyltransferase, GNAT family [Micromonospora peucetia]
MTDEQYLRYRQQAETNYARNISDSGAMPVQEAQQKAQEEYAKLLPDGLATPDHHLWTAYDGDDEVGMLWLHVEQKSDGAHAFGYDFEVRADLRRKGHGRAMIEAAEKWCREEGVVSIGLSVFGFNLPARTLYEQMGFEATAIQMRKRL